jgi:hypothetical protein
VFAELFCLPMHAAATISAAVCVQTRENFNATRDKTESLMKKMLEVRQTVNTVMCDNCTMFVVDDKDP